MEKQAGSHQATAMLYGTVQDLKIGLLALWKILELALGVYNPMETKGYQVVHIMFQMMHGCIRIMVGTLQMPMMSA